MALSILDGNQSATTLSTILSSGQHITAHTVVSLGTQAITDIVNATSANLTNTQLRASAVTVGGTVTVGNSVTIGSLPNVKIQGFNAQGGGLYIDVGVTESGAVAVVLDSELPAGTAQIGTVTANLGSALPTGTNRIGVVTIGAGTVTIGAGTAQIGSVTASVSGTVTVGVLPDLVTSTDFEQAGTQIAAGITNYGLIPVGIVAGSVTIGSALPAGTNRIGVVTIGAGTVTIGAGTAQIGSVTASISNSLTISSLPAISGTVTGNINDPTGIAIATQITDALFGSDALLNALTNLPISGTVTANTFAVQGTAVTTSNFTSTTASTVLASFNATREVLTIFNEGAGNLHIAPGVTCTTIAYQVRISAGDYYEVPNHQTTITHSAVFATAGTARVTQVS